MPQNTTSPEPTKTSSTFKGWLEERTAPAVKLSPPDRSTATDPRPLVLDLCRGLGGWSKGFIAEGWRAIGIDLADFSAQYPGEFIQADLLKWEGWRKLTPALVVASPPCEQFTRHSLPWTRKKNPPPPDLAIKLVERCQFIASQLGVQMVLENVRGAQPFIGKAKANCGPYYLWGDVPAIVPTVRGTKTTTWFNTAQRAHIPYTLSVWIARVFKPSVVANPV